MKLEIKTNWTNLTLGEFSKIEKILSTEEDFLSKQTEILTLLSGQDASKYPLSELPFDSLKFLKQTPPEVSLKEEYRIHGKLYTCSASIDKITTAQYIDFQNISKEKNIIKSLACFLIPVGSEYGDGYDIEDVYKDLEHMLFVDANKISFFLLRQFKLFTTIFLDYLMTSQMTQMEIPKEKQNEILQPLLNITI